MAQYQILLYYIYTPIAEAEQFAADHLAFCKSIGLKGRIIVASEGLNGTVSGTPEVCRIYMEALKADERFESVDFKIDESEIQAFQKMHVRHKSEIVYSGLRNPSVINPSVRTGKHISGKTLLEMKKDEDVVILDVRSNYEHIVGHFEGAVRLDIENFREFPEKIEELKHLKDKKIITYCTGGIKCEKASALLLEHGFKDVYQLHGGIIKYAKETGGEDFNGVCYVFDNRVTVPVNEVNPKIVSVCYCCGVSSARMINCGNPECNEHVPMCESCGWKMNGACCVACMSHPRLRIYDGTGYYVKPGHITTSKK